MKKFTIPNDPLIWEPENDEENVEYKSYLSKEHDNKRKIERLSTQMLWRLTEGERLYNKHRAVYVLGIMDDGKLYGLDKQARNDSIDIIEKVATVCHAVIYRIVIIKTHLGEISVLYIQGPKHIRDFIL